MVWAVQPPSRDQETVSLLLTTDVRTVRELEATDGQKRVPRADCALVNRNMPTAGRTFKDEVHCAP